jgi:hypothetical protein
MSNSIIIVVVLLGAAALISAKTVVIEPEVLAEWKSWKEVTKRFYADGKDE